MALIVLYSLFLTLILLKLVIFEGKDNAHNFLPCRVLRWARDYDHNLNLITPAKKSIPNIAVKQVKWSPPPHHWIKINTNGSLLGDLANASCGGIARNHHGNFVAAWSFNVGTCSITTSELWGIFRGLLIGWNLGIEMYGLRHILFVLSS